MQNNVNEESTMITTLRPVGRLLRASTAALLLSVLVIGTAVAPAAAAPGDGTTIVGVGSGKCLDVIGNNSTNKTGVNTYTCVNQPNQLWTFTAAGELRTFNGTKCLDVEGRKITSPARVQIFDCTGGPNQKWAVNASGTITGVQSNLCLDVTGNSTANSALVGLYTCNNQPNQKWTTSFGSGDIQPPSTPGNPRVSNLTCDSVVFSWDASTDNVGVVAYDIYHDGQFMKSVAGTVLSTDLAVVAGAQWGLYVNARDAADKISVSSNSVSITPPPCQVDTQAPTTPTGLVGTASGTSVTLRWTASTDNIQVRAYDIYRGGAKVGTVSGTGATAPVTTFIDSGLAPRTSYAYQVIARDAQTNSSGRSNTATVTTGASCTGSVCSVTELTTDTDLVWGLTTLPDGSVIYSRRDVQEIVRLDPATGAKTIIGKVPDVQGTDGEGGLLGIAISSSFATDRWLYIMHSSPTDNRVVRIKMTGNSLELSSKEVLVSGILKSKFHNGGRLRFGPDGKLYVSTGDAENTAEAQKIGSLNGKILRVNPDGTVPSDNPFGNFVWSYGHRNPQGLAFDSQGRLWEQEFGNGLMDETNLITKGGNYGWPACEGTSGQCGTAGYIAPKRTYPTADGSCSGIAIVRDVLYVACLRGTRLYRQTISGTSLTTSDVLFNGTYGRLRTVEPSSDGGLWLTTSNGLTAGNAGDKDNIPNNSNSKILKVTLGG